MAKSLTPPLHTLLVARWIIETVESRGQVARTELLDGIRGKFGDQFFQRSKTGRLGLVPTIGDQIRRVGQGSVVFDRNGDVWRRRSKGSDEP